jgi:hypothetical protein
MTNDKRLTDDGLTAREVRGAFQAVAEYCGGDILQACRDCGEDPVIDRDGLIDYLSIHGGDAGPAVSEYCMSYPGDWAALDAHLDDLGVPRQWV